MVESVASICNRFPPPLPRCHWVMCSYGESSFTFDIQGVETIHPLNVGKLKMGH